MRNPSVDAKQPCIYHGGETDEPNTATSSTVSLSESIQDVHRQWNPQHSEAPAFKKRRSISISSELRNQIINQCCIIIESPQAAFIPGDFVRTEAVKSPFLFNAFSGALVLTDTKKYLPEIENRELAFLFYENAIHSLPQALSKQSIVNVMALVVYCNMYAEHMNFRSMAVQFAQDLKLHEFPLIASTQEEHYRNCLRLNLFWWVFVLDVTTAIHIQRPPLIDNSKVKVPLPVLKEEFDLQVFNAKMHQKSLEIGIVSSKACYYPTLPDTCHNRYWILISIHSLISSYAQDRKKSLQVHDPALDYKEAALFASLASWKQVQIVKDDPLSFSIENWYDYYLYLIYHSAVLSLTTARFMKIPESEAFRFSSTDGFKSCFQSAERITAIVRALKANQMLTVTYGHYFISQALFASSIIYEAGLKVHGNPVLIGQSERLWAENLQYCKELSGLGFPCAEQYARLQEREAARSDIKGDNEFESLFAFYFEMPPPSP
ncbi:hypothetical protein EDD86DRAFT_248152 [Gorgonomyces haynaldii]|nr:hypothetical protein EDD86DRAFT_248152 [Gorgonomyces haynaldii]